MRKINYCIECNDYVECDITSGNREDIPKNCPLPDYDWKEKLLEWIESMKWDVAESFMEPEDYVVSFDALKQKIKEM
jgi:hypothetical protein